MTVTLQYVPTSQANPTAQTFETHNKEQFLDFFRFLGDSYCELVVGASFKECVIDFYVVFVYVSDALSLLMKPDLRAEAVTLTVIGVPDVGARTGKGPV